MMDFSVWERYKKSNYSCTSRSFKKPIKNQVWMERMLIVEDDEVDLLVYSTVRIWSLDWLKLLTFLDYYNCLVGIRMGGD